MTHMAQASDRSATRWERRGQQVRSHRTQDAILDAAEELFARRGVETTAVTDVAAASGRSIGSIYHHFTNKETLVAAVVDRLLDDLETSVATAIDPSRWQGQDIRGVALAYVGNSLRLDERRPGFKRIIVEVSLVDAATRERYHRLRRRLDDGITALLLERRTEIGHPEPELAARFCVDQLTAMLTARLDSEMTPTQLEAAPDEAFVRHAVESVAGHLRLASAGS